MTTTRHSILDCIKITRSTQREIRELEKRLSQWNIPTLIDTSKLSQIYTQIQSAMNGEELREQRLCFVFIAAYLYSPSSIYGNYPLKTGLRSKIASIIHRCNTEVSEMFTEARFRYERLPNFRDKIEIILANNLHNGN